MKNTTQKVIYYPNGPDDYDVELVEKATIAKDNFDNELVEAHLLEPNMPW